MKSRYIRASFVFVFLYAAVFFGGTLHKAESNPHTPLGIKDVIPRCILLDNKKVNITLVLQGAFSANDLQITIGDKKHDIKSHSGDSVLVEFDTKKKTPGPLAINIETGEEKYSWNSTIFLAGDPTIYVDDQTKQRGNNYLQAAYSFRIKVPGVPAEAIKVSLGRSSLTSTPVDSTVRVDVPQKYGGLMANLNVSAYGGTFWKSKNEYSIIPVPIIDEASVKYNTADRELRAALWGEHLTKEIEVKFAINDLSKPRILTYSQSDEEGRAAVFKALQVDRPKGTDMGQIEVSWRGQSLFKTSNNKWQSIPGEGLEWISSSSQAGNDLKTILEDIFSNDVPGKIKIADEEYTFVLIPAKSNYPIGFNNEQRLDETLLKKGISDASTSLLKKPIPVRLLHPFLILANEVTCQQYWSFLMAHHDANVKPEIPKQLQKYYENKHLPMEFRDLPVTGISYLGARKYVKWLQNELHKFVPNWQLRLPHEIEWEMAAREDDRRFTFEERDVQNALELMKNPEPYPIRSNKYDKSTHVVWDLSGNVSELTETAYNKSLLGILETKLNTSMFEGWDPRNPFATPGLLQPLPQSESETAEVCMRGGANGEQPPYFQVSVRRAQMWSASDEKTGFRLVLVKLND